MAYLSRHAFYSAPCRHTSAEFDTQPGNHPSNAHGLDMLPVALCCRAAVTAYLGFRRMLTVQRPRRKLNTLLAHKPPAQHLADFAHASLDSR